MFATVGGKIVRERLCGEPEGRTAGVGRRICEEKVRKMERKESVNKKYWYVWRGP